MSTSDLGTKQLCPNCGAKFYDLNKRPAECPKCQHSFEPDAEEILAARTTAAVKAKPKAAPEDDEDEDLDEAPATGAEADEDESEEETVAELGTEDEATLPVGDSSDDDNDEAGVKGVPAGFSEQGVDDDDILDEDEAEEFDIDIDVEVPDDDDDDEDDLPGE